MTHISHYQKTTTKIQEIITLRATLTTDKYEEEIFIRGGAFKRETPRIYNNTCCISELNINAIINISMIDACHIVPFSESYNDTVSNGIALCPNLHRAFDRGLISIDQEFSVIISNCFSENETNYSIRQFEGKPIALPTDKKHFPDLENLYWHYKHILKNK